MNTLSYTHHAETRIQQRGIREKDIPLIIELGTQIDDETWFMRNRDVTREIESLKKEIHRLERLANRKVVIRSGRVITAYLSQPADQKRTLRRGRQKGVAK